ncbi:hypothetical protein [uncultured Pedobacter sp.]|uniref:hypothetical protein n=1 Tax=uncultured Pedobacter sp. TaxID=246139 RepID=UPI0025FDAA77|nr:hypothetical protein [uncultured Pedobacter sp.]
MSNNNEQSTTKTEKQICDDVAKYATFGISICGAILYTVEKVNRYPEIIAENLNADALVDNAAVQAVKRPLSLVSTLISTTNYIAMFLKYAAPIHGYLQSTEDKILCCKVKEAPRYFIYTYFVFMAIGAGALYYTQTETVAWLKSKHKNYKKALSLLTKTMSFGSGVLLLATTINNADSMKGRRLFTMCSILDGLSAPLDFHGIDNLVFRVDNQGYAYAGVYGMRSAIKIGQTIGFLIADK